MCSLVVRAGSGGGGQGRSRRGWQLEEDLTTSSFPLITFYFSTFNRF